MEVQVSYLINVHSLKWCLQKFKIVNILMFQLCLKFYFLQTNAAREEHVHELAIGRSWKETRTVLEWVSPRCGRGLLGWKGIVLTGAIITQSRVLLAVCVLPTNALIFPCPQGLSARGKGLPQQRSTCQFPTLNSVYCTACIRVSPASTTNKQNLTL